MIIIFCTCLEYDQCIILLAVMCISQPHAFHCVTKTVPEWPDPPFCVLVMLYIQRCGGVVWFMRIGPIYVAIDSPPRITGVIVPLGQLVSW